MPTTQELQAIATLRAHAARGDTQGVEITYRLTGGAPGEQIEDAELRVSGSGAIQARQRSVSSAVQESSGQVTETELKALLHDLGEGLGELIPRSEARFVPDSLVGHISVRVDGQEASFFFLPDAEQARQQGKALPEMAARAVGVLDRLRGRILPR
jgi:hypothetical protein